MPKLKWIIFLVIIIAIAILIILWLRKPTGSVTAKSNSTALPNVTVYAFSISSESFFFDGEKDMLNDAGFKKDGLLIVERLRFLNVSKLDIIIPSHSDSDHVGGIPVIMSEFAADKILYIDNETYPNSTSVYRGYKEPFGEGEIEILSPPMPLISNKSNDNSVVWKLRYGDVSFLFTGDCQIKCEENILDSGLNVTADVLKVGHHGSDTSTSEKFLKAVNPRVAIIGVGSTLKGRYNLPDNEIIERLKTHGVKTFRTDEGEIKITTNGMGFDVCQSFDGTC